MIKYQSAFHTIEILCEVLGVSRSGYYAWLSHSPSQREQADAVLANEIVVLFEHSRSTYGVPRMHKALEALGKRHDKARVARIMRVKGLKAKAAKHFKATTDSRHRKTVAPNILAQNFNPEGLNVAWCADIT